jgi:hypothetical protein
MIPFDNNSEDLHRKGKKLRGTNDGLFDGLVTVRGVVQKKLK